MSRHNEDPLSPADLSDGAGETNRSSQGFVLVAEKLKSMAHPVRVQMLYRLLDREQTVAWLAHDAAIPANVASTHLRRMSHLGIIKSARRGKFVCYRIIDPVVRALLIATRQWSGAP